jgi:PmbA/TldA metallopeptidase C-terminal domain
MIRNILSSVMLSAGLLQAADDVVMRAMRDELARSMKKLQLENLQKPYFVAYRVLEQDGCGVEASFGALIRDSCDPKNTGTRRFGVEVRVGDYSRDNTNFFAPNFGTPGVTRLMMPGIQAVPIDDNYDELRRQLWLGTDSAYKAALDLYARKKAALENRNRTDDAPDFSKEPVVNDSETAPPIVWNRAELVALVKSLSALFRETPGIDNSSVVFSGTNYREQYVNSEGTTFTRNTSSVSVKVNADTQAVDGLPLADFLVVYGRSMQELPPREELAKRIRALQARLESLRKAPLVERYTGPVLFEDQAAAELFMQTMGSALAGAPRLVVEDSRMERMYNTDAGLAERVGARVLPDFLTITDNPSAKEFHGQPLMGSYQVDEEGVKAGSTVVVDQGVLKVLLHTRSLVPGTTQSTASRRGMGTTPSNLVFTASKSMPSDQLKAELIRLIKQRNKEFGISVRRMSDQQLMMSLMRSRVIIFGSSNAPGTIDVEPLIEAYKVFPDGHEELVRNLTINGLTMGALKDILAVSDSPAVQTMPYRQRIFLPMTAGMTNVGTGPALVSVVIPNLLFDEMTLQRPKGDVPNLPFTRHPFFDK